MLPDEVKSARKALGLSQAELAERLGLGPNGKRKVRRWEKGELPVPDQAAAAIARLTT